MEDSSDDNWDQDDDDVNYIDYITAKRERGQLPKQKPGAVMFIDQEPGEPEESDEEVVDDNAESESDCALNSDDEELPDLDTSEYVQGTMMTSTTSTKKQPKRRGDSFLSKSLVMSCS